MSEENKAPETAEVVETKEEAAPAAPQNNQELGLVGKKVGMTQIFDEEGNVVPVTVISLAENIVTGIKTKEKDGYDAIQVGNFESKEKHINKPKQGFFKKNNLPLLKKLKEYRVSETPNVQVGDALNATEFFENVEKVNVTGKSIGKGFQGGVKLHNMHVGRRSHGSKSKRQIGSLGAGTDPSRVFKGKRMPSMMGNRMVTTTKIKFVKYCPEKNVVLVRGPIPGKPGAVVTVKPYGLKTWNANNKATRV